MIFSTDINMGKSNDADNILVRSMFDTVQGEMPYAGRRALFLRLGGCNRGAKTDCPFCDTSFEVNKSQWKPVNTLVDEVTQEIQHSNAELLVITGGEPLLQSLALANFIPLLLARIPVHVQFETNGDVEFRFLDRLVGLKHVTFVVSPKGSPIAPLERAFRFNLLKQLYWAQWPNVFVRFVVGDPPYHQLPPELFDLVDRNNIYLSPCTVYRENPIGRKPEDCIDFAASQKTAQHAFVLAKEHRVRMSFQSHAYLGIE